MKFNLLKFLSGVAGLFAFGFFCLNGNVAFADDLSSTGKTLVGISEYNDVFSENYYNDRVLNNNEEKSSLSFQYPGAHIVRVTFDFESVDSNSVTVRYRDSMKQERIKIDNLRNFLEKELLI